MRFIRTNRQSLNRNSLIAIPLVVAAVTFGPPVVAGATAQTATPSHKHYDDSTPAPAPARHWKGADAALTTSLRE